MNKPYFSNPISINDTLKSNYLIHMSFPELYLSDDNIYIYSINDVGDLDNDNKSDILLSSAYDGVLPNLIFISSKNIYYNNTYDPKENNSAFIILDDINECSRYWSRTNFFGETDKFVISQLCRKNFYALDKNLVIFKTGEYRISKHDMVVFSNDNINSYDNYVFVGELNDDIFDDIIFSYSIDDLSNYFISRIIYGGNTKYLAGANYSSIEWESTSNFFIFSASSESTLVKQFPNSKHNLVTKYYGPLKNGDRVLSNLVIDFKGFSKGFNKLHSKDFPIVLLNTSDLIDQWGPVSSGQDFNGDNIFDYIYKSRITGYPDSNIILKGPLSTSKGVTQFNELNTVKISKNRVCGVGFSTVFVGDINNDGKDDIASFSEHCQDWYHKSVKYHVSYGGINIIFGDDTSKKREDLSGCTINGNYIEETDNDLRYYTFDPSFNYLPKWKTNPVGLKDVNGDGIDDLVFTYYEKFFFSNTIKLHLGIVLGSKHFNCSLLNSSLPFPSPSPSSSPNPSVSPSPTPTSYSTFSPSSSPSNQPDFPNNNSPKNFFESTHGKIILGTSSILVLSGLCLYIFYKLGYHNIPSNQLGNNEESEPFGKSLEIQDYSGLAEK